MNKIKLAVVSVCLFFVFAFGASADALGQNQRFFISPQYDAQSRSLVNATLRHVSEHAYFYVADDYWYGISVLMHNQVLTQINTLADEFDKRIYPTETQFFGLEPNPGIDGDSRITILLTPLIENAGGYFNAANQYQISEAPDSNQREMIYLNIGKLDNPTKMFVFLAHEFQHLISFNQKEKLRNISDDVWLNELRSEYAATLLGYDDIFKGSNLQKRSRDLADAPSDSLTEWKNTPDDYGQIGMLEEYIAEHWSPRVIADTLKNNFKSIPSLNESLLQNGFSSTFIDIYRNWLISNFLNDGSYNVEFAYSRAELANFKIAATKTINIPKNDTTLAIHDSIKDWQGKWYDITQLILGQNNVLKINFDSPSLASFTISYIVFGLDGKYKAYAFNPMPGSNMLYISGIGTDVSRVVIMPIKKDKLSGFSANEIPVQLTTAIERVSSAPAAAAISTSIPAYGKKINTAPPMLKSDILDGSLIRAIGDYKVYVVKGGWRGHIISPKIFNFYSGFGFNMVREVDPSVLNQYQESNLIRYAGSKRIYSIDDLGNRHWLNMSGEKFSDSGRSWNSVFDVNLKELNFYKIGTSIVK